MSAAAGAPVAPRPAGARAVTAMVVATLLWGGTFVVLRDSLPRVAPVPLVFGRFAAAALVLAVILLLRRRAPDRAALLGGLGAGALAAGGYLFQAIGLTTTSAGTSAFLTCTGTLFAAFFAWPLLGQRPAPLLTVGILVAIVGSGLLSLRGPLRPGPGELWTLAGSLAYALQIVVLARVAPRADPVALSAVQALAIALTLVPFAGGATARILALEGDAAWRFGYLVLAGSVAAPLLQVVAQRTLPPGRIGLLFALEPVFALVFALALGGERFEPRWWAGASLILGAVVMVEGRAASREAAAPPAASAPASPAGAG